MIVNYVEQDESGNVVHEAQVFIAEGPDAPPSVPEPIEEPTKPAERRAARRERQTARAARGARIREMTAERASEISRELQAAPGVTVLGTTA